MVLLLEDDSIEKKRWHIWIDSSFLKGKTVTLDRKLMENKTKFRQYLHISKYEKLVGEAGHSSGTQRKGNVRRWQPLPNNS
jgi:hypothetical protein